MILLQCGDITNYKTPFPNTLDNQQLADDLNDFYCRFGKTSHTRPEHRSTTINTSSNLPLPHTCTENNWRWRAPGLQREQKKESTRTRWRDTSLSEILCWPAGPHLQTDLQQIPGAVRSPLMLQMLHHHPRPKETQNYWTLCLQTCGSNVCGHEIIWKTGFGLSLHWTLTGPPAVCLQSKQVCGWCSQHGTALHPAASGQTRDLCEDPVCRDFSSAFNIIIPDTLQNKLTQLSVPTSVCQWSKKVKSSPVGQTLQPLWIRL